MAANQQQQKLRVATLIEQDAKEALKEANVQHGSTVMEPKKSPGTMDIGRGERLVTNMYSLDMNNKRSIFRYEVAVFGVLADRDQAAMPKLIDLTIRKTEDYRCSNNRYMCVAVYKAFNEKFSAQLRCNLLYYDGQQILYSLNDMKLPPGGIEADFSYEQVSRFAVSNEGGFATYKITIVPVKDEKKVLTIGDLSHITSDSANVDRSNEQFLDIATSQEVLDDPKQFLHFDSSNIYLLDPPAHGFFQEDCPYFASNSSFLGIGLHKGVRPVELAQKTGGTGVGASEGLVVSVKKTPFHVVESVANKLIALVGSKNTNRFNDTEWLKDRFEGQLKGLYVAATHREKPRIFQIHGFSSTNVNTELINVDGKMISLYEYFTKKYKIDLKYTGFPLIMQKLGKPGGGSNILFYPTEVCQIMDNQRVKSEQQHPQQIREMIRKTAVPPAVLRSQDEKLKQVLKLDSSAFLSEAGIVCRKEPMQVTARLLPPPELEFAAHSKQTPKQPANTWMGGAQYFSTTKCPKWAAIALSGREQDALPRDDWIAFVNKFCAALQQKGMQFAKPHVDHLQIHGVQIKALVQTYYEDGYEYMFIAHPDSADEVHHAMKFFEQRTEVVTQGVKITTVKNVLYKNQMLTLGNIIQKTNMKMGGLNYSVAGLHSQPELRSIFNDETLIIGFGANHPSGALGGNKNGNGAGNGNIPGANGNAPGNGANGNGNSNGNAKQAIPSSFDHGPPSVVGFSANVGKNGPFDFIGDFVFQTAFRDEKVRIISSIVNRCAAHFNAVKGKFPRQVIIYRNGCSEGAFQKILEYEVPLIRKALTDLGCNAGITLIVVNKLQDIRFYARNINPGVKSARQNILPGTVVDTGVVHPLWNEFFLNPHVALQGTAKTPKYTVLVDENKLTTDTLQGMTHSLCYGHQIVYSPTSLPTPVMVALEYAKRGRNIFNYWIFSGSGVSTGEARDYRRMTEHLSYENTAYLRNLHLNA